MWRGAIEVPGGAGTLRVMLAYSDAAGTLGEPKALTNDLDITLTSPSGETLRPLVLDPALPGAPAVAGVNSRDPIEQVVVAAPTPGTWTVEVAGTAVPTVTQPFHVVWSFADNPAPPCLTTVVPKGLIVRDLEGATVLNVTRPSSCPAWTLETDAPWLKVITPVDQAGGGVAKLLYPANDSGAVRTAGLKLSDVSLAFTQNAPCQASPAQTGVTAAALTQSDCITEYGTYAKTFTFRAEAGQSVTINLDSTAFDAWLELYGPGNVLVAYNDDNQFTSNSRIPSGTGSLTLPLTGEYTILATTYYPGETGDFAIGFGLDAERPVPNNPPPSPVLACPHAVDGELTAESSLAGRRGSENYTNRYLFYLHAGQTVTADIAEAGFDTMLYLTNTSGSLVAMNDDWGLTTRSHLTYAARATGYHTLEVTSFQPRVLGKYSVTINGCAELK